MGRDELRRCVKELKYQEQLGQINALGVSMTVPITTGGTFARNAGLAVMVSGHATTGVAVCNQVRSFDIAARVRAGTE